MGEVVAYKAKRPHEKGVLCDTSFLAAHERGGGGGGGKSFTVWVRLGRAKRPHAKRYYMMCYPLLPMERIGKSLRMWVRLGKANRPHAKRGTYHASVFGL